MSNWELISKYLANESSKEETNELEAWRERSSKNEDFFLAQKRLWNKTQVPSSFSQIDTVRGLNKLHDAINAVEGKSHSRYRLLQYAAAVVLLASAISTWLFYQKTTVHLINSNEKALIVDLPDGSKVWLNSGAEVTYQERMDDEMRQVELIGEAYFDVKNIPEKPFMVHAKEVEVLVVGTEFNVKTDEQAAKVSVTVAEGKVSMRGSSTQNERILLEVLEVGSFDLSTKKLEKKRADHLNEISWKTGKLEFKQSTFRYLSEQLERHYNIEIVLSEQLDQCTISTVFDNLLLEEVFEILKSTVNINIERKGVSYFFSGTCS